MDGPTNVAIPGSIFAMTSAEQTVAEGSAFRPLRAGNVVSVYITARDRTGNAQQKGTHPVVEALSCFQEEITS